MTDNLLTVLSTGCTPTKGSKYSAAIDLYAAEPKTIYPGHTAIVGLGVAINQDHLKQLESNIYEIFMQTHYMALMPRSSIRAKGLSANVGIIDMDYPDEIKLILQYPYRDDTRPYEIAAGDRIAQLMVCSHNSILFDIKSEDERTGGIGSTDK